MDLLRLTILICSCSGGVFAATPGSGWTKDKHIDHCASSKEFNEVRSFLQEQQSLSLPESEIRKVSYAVTKGCNHASDLFKSTYKLLEKSGVDHRFALTVATEQSQKPEGQVKVFQDAFRYLFLEDYLDLDYKTSYRTARELANSWSGSDSQIGKDFVETVQFCLDSKGLSLSQKECLKVSLAVANLSRYFPGGSFQAFRDLLLRLRESENLKFSREIALAIVMKVLPHGPNAPANFLESYEYALSPKGLNETSEGALAHALKLAAESHRGDLPPVVESQ